MDITYCYNKCTIGKAASDDFLANHNSAVDAAIEFNFFTQNCFKICPYKSNHITNGGTLNENV